MDLPAVALGHLRTKEEVGVLQELGVPSQKMVGEPAVVGERPEVEVELP